MIYFRQQHLIHTLCVWSFAFVSITASSNCLAAPRNVILIIGDGMDDQQITIARNYLHGANGQLTLNTMPVRSSVQVLSVAEDDGQRVVYVADSANSATAMATGRVTSRGRIATSAAEDNDLTTIAELAKAGGYGVGIVTTASVTDATPASFISHINQRSCESPSMMVDGKLSGRARSNCDHDLKANGGPGSIAEQITDSPYDIILGGGRKFFNETAEGTDNALLDRARGNGFYIATAASHLNRLPSNQKVLGLFASKHLPVRLRGEHNRKAEKPQPSLLNRIDWRLGDVAMPATMTCENNPDYGATPSLQAMTSAALQHLSRSTENKTENTRGFFLMVESASIDKQSHARNPCGSIGELQQLEEVVQTALGYAEHHPQTLILVTADHGQVAQIIPDQSLFQSTGVPVYTPGHIARIETPEASVMAINYATNSFPIEEHTGVNVPLFANDLGRTIVDTMMRQTDIFSIMRNHLQLAEHLPLVDQSTSK